MLGGNLDQLVLQQTIPNVICLLSELLFYDKDDKIKTEHHDEVHLET